MSFAKYNPIRTKVKHDKFNSTRKEFSENCSDITPEQNQAQQNRIQKMIEGVQKQLENED